VLHPHHVKTRSRGGEWHDLIPLCPLCHHSVHSQPFSEEARDYMKEEAARLAQAARDANGPVDYEF